MLSRMAAFRSPIHAAHGPQISCVALRSDEILRASPRLMAGVAGALYLLIFIAAPVGECIHRERRACIRAAGAVG